MLEVEGAEQKPRARGGEKNRSLLLSVDQEEQGRSSWRWEPVCAETTPKKQNPMRLGCATIRCDSVHALQKKKVVAFDDEMGGGSWADAQGTRRKGTTDAARAVPRGSIRLDFSD